MSHVSGAAGRTETFRRLSRRHLIIAALRIGVPIIGLLAFAALAAQIYFASFLGGLGVEGLRLERDSLIVDRPDMAGTLAGVGRYEFSADSASTQLSAATGLDLDRLAARLLFDSGATADLAAPGGRFDFGPRLLTLTGPMSLRTSDGITGEAQGATIDMPAQTLAADAGVAFSFPGGSTLAADTMFYDANSGALRFERVRLSITPQRLTSEAAP